MGTGEHDLDLKAKKVSEWLHEGHRVKIDLFLPGRTKYMDFNFLKERLGRILKLVTEEYKVADEAKKKPKGHHYGYRTSKINDRKRPMKSNKSF